MALRDVDARRCIFRGDGNCTVKKVMYASCMRGTMVCWCCTVDKRIHPPAKSSSCFGFLLRDDDVPTIVMIIIV